MILSDRLLDDLVAQDAPFGDLTTSALGIDGRPGRISFAARDGMTLCCAEEAARMIERAGAKPRLLRTSGDAIAAGEVFLEGEGTAAALHVVWKTAQTLMEYASGMASAARRIVDAARAVNPDIAVECTRKNLPGSRAIAVRAVQAGGAQMHRLGLSGSLLVFPEHLTFLGGLPTALGQITTLKRHHPGRKLTVETGSIDDAVALAEAGADILQLERMNPDEAKQVVDRTRHCSPPPAVAAAGGVNAANAAAYAAAGCAILVSSAPYFARPADVRVVIAAAQEQRAL